MATYINFDKVQYGVAENICAPLCNLYFCKHCLKLKSLNCVFQEVESCYCPNCLEQCQPTEAKQRKNKCISCFNCPCCFHILSKRAANVTTSSSDVDEANKAISKVYYLACSFCRWTSRDAGIKDQQSATGVWLEEQNLHAKRISNLQEYYNALSQLELISKDKKKTKRRSQLHVSEKLGLGKLIARRRSGLAAMGIMSRDEDIKIPEIEPSVASEIVDELGDDVFTSPVVLTQVTTVSQRLASPDFQPVKCSELRPFRSLFFIKRSLRCRECQHNLCKPDARPDTIKFKIQMHAINYVPEVRIMSPPSLIINKECPIALTLFNPFDSSTTVSLHSLQNDSFSNARVILPSCELILSAREEGSEYDNSQDHQHGMKDDASVIIFRKVNKIGFLIRAVPLKSDGNVKVAFMMKYSYLNRQLSLPNENKDPETVWLQHPIYLCFDTVQDK